MKTNILFTGYYGHKNTGDDAFIEVTSWGANKIWNESNFRFLGIDNRLPQTIYPSKGFPFTLPKSYRFQNELLIRNTNYLISSGGSTIHSSMTKNNPKSIAVALKNRGRKIKIGGIGVSIGPFNSIYDEEHVKEYLKSIDFLSLRDEYSYKYARSLNLPYEPVNSFDLAALLPDVYSFENKTLYKQKKEKVIGISVCPYESIVNSNNIKDEDNRNNNVIELIRELDKNENVHFKFYIINGSDKVGDKNLTYETIQKSKPKSYEVVDYNKTTRNTWESISDCDFLIATRLHAAIFACFANIPFMLNEYHRKCGDFLDNVGYNESYRLYNNEYDIKEKSIQIVNILNNKNEYVKPIFVDEMKSRALLNFTSINI